MSSNIILSLQFEGLQNAIYEQFFFFKHEILFHKISILFISSTLHDSKAMYTHNVHSLHKMSGRRNMLRNSLASTGAFEVFADGQLVFSKLQSGRMPTAEELRGGIAGLMLFQSLGFLEDVRV